MSFRKHPVVEEQIQPILGAIEHEASRLPVWQLAGGLALDHALAAFEGDVRMDEPHLASTGDAVVSSAAGVNAIVRIIYRRHAGSGVTASDSFDRHVFDQARHALRYASASALAVESLDDACYGTRRLVMPDCEVFLPLTREGTIEHETRIALQASESRTGTTDRALLSSTLRPDLIVGGYSVDEFRQVYHHLRYWAASHRRAGWPGGAKVGDPPPGCLPLRVRHEDLWTELVGERIMEEAAFRQIVEDLTYDFTLPWADVWYQPLLPTTPGEFLVAPSLLTRGRWERVLLRIWSHKYHDDYSRAVAAEKTRAAEYLTSALAACGYLTASNRPLHPYSGRTMGIGNVLAFDAASDILLLVQLTWLIAPFSAHESRLALAAISKGVDRIAKVEKFIREYPAKATRQLFAPQQVPVGPHTQVCSFLVDCGYINSLAFLSQGAPILDLQRFRNYIGGAGSLAPGLRMVARGINDFLPRSDTSLQPNFIDPRFALGGYSFRIPDIAEGGAGCGPTIPPRAWL